MFPLPTSKIMLWQLLRGSGYGEYCYRATGNGDTVGDLDPILCAGQMNLHALQASAKRMFITFVIQALLIIMSRDGFEAQLKKPEG